MPSDSHAWELLDRRASERKSHGGTLQAACFTIQYFLTYTVLDIRWGGWGAGFSFRRLTLELLLVVDQIRSDIHTRTQAYTRKTPKEIRTGTPIG